jgi:folate-dependent phosphoribosylglycinamide formyltransferase PurN
VRADDTEDTLSERILEAEHWLYPHALRLVASGRAWVEGEAVRYKDAADKAALLNGKPE